MRKLFVSLLMIVGISVSCYAFGSAFANLNQNKTMDGYDEFAKIGEGISKGQDDFYISEWYNRSLSKMKSGDFVKYINKLIDIYAENGKGGREVGEEACSFVARIYALNKLIYEFDSPEGMFDWVGSACHSGFDLLSN